MLPKPLGPLGLVSPAVALSADPEIEIPNIAIASAFKRFSAALSAARASRRRLGLLSELPAVRRLAPRSRVVAFRPWFRSTDPMLQNPTVQVVPDDLLTCDDRALRT